MAIDYAEREREFLAGLEADTGHDLAGWMALIEAQKLAHRTDIIDWHEEVEGTMEYED